MTFSDVATPLKVVFSAAEWISGASIVVALWVGLVWPSLKLYRRSPDPSSAGFRHAKEEV